MRLTKEEKAKRRYYVAKRDSNGFIKEVVRKDGEKISGPEVCFVLEFERRKYARS